MARFGKFRQYFKILVFILFIIISIDYALKIKEKKFIKFLFDNYTFKQEKTFLLKKLDSNNEKFDALVNKYCNVYLVNTTVECLKKLAEYDVKKVHFIFDEKNTDFIYYHTFWQPVKSKSHHLNVMKLNILSYLATQNLTRTRLIVWSLQKLSVEDEIKQEFVKYIKSGVLQFRILDLKKLCMKGVFGLKYQYCTQVTNSNLILLSDFVRFLVLYNFGGIYFDGDVLLLRDMIPFWDKTFVYRWSYTESYNTAVMGLNIGHSKEIEDIFKISVLPVLSGKDLVDIFYPMDVTKTIQLINVSDIFTYKDLNVYSSVLFDPAWLCYDSGLVFADNEKFSDNVPLCSFPGFYDLKIDKKDFSIKNFFPGAFTYHLHLSSCGSCKINQHSYCYHIEKYFRSII